MGRHIALGKRSMRGEVYAILRMSGLSRPLASHYYTKTEALGSARNWTSILSSVGTLGSVGVLGSGSGSIETPGANISLTENFLAAKAAALSAAKSAAKSWTSKRKRVMSPAAHGTLSTAFAGTEESLHA